MPGAQTLTLSMPEPDVALLTFDTPNKSSNVLSTSVLEELTEHLKVHKKDNHTRYGLLKMVGRRSRLLKYLQRHNPDRYRDVISKLGIRARR